VPPFTLDYLAEQLPAPTILGDVVPVSASLVVHAAAAAAQAYGGRGGDRYGDRNASVFFSAHDNDEGNPVSFSATATAGPFFTSKSGTVTTDTASFTLAFHRAKETRFLRIAIELSDPWGNTSTIKKNVRLR
jgi:hypothetical protein